MKTRFALVIASFVGAGPARGGTHLAQSNLRPMSSPKSEVTTRAIGRIRPEGRQVIQNAGAKYSRG